MRCGVPSQLYSTVTWLLASGRTNFSSPRRRRGQGARRWSRRASELGWAPLGGWPSDTDSREKGWGSVGRVEAPGGGKGEGGEGSAGWGGLWGGGGRGGNRDGRVSRDAESS